MHVNGAKLNNESRYDISDNQQDYDALILKKNEKNYAKKYLFGVLYAVGLLLRAKPLLCVDVA